MGVARTYVYMRIKVCQCACVCMCACVCSMWELSENNLMLGNRSPIHENYIHPFLVTKEQPYIVLCNPL